MGISCVKFKAVLHIRANVNQGKIWGGGQGARSSVGTGSKWESRLCLLPRDAASIPSSLKGIQEEGKGDGAKGAVLEVNLGQWLLLALNPLGKKKKNKNKHTAELYLDNFGVGFLMGILEDFLCVVTWNVLGQISGGFYLTL